MPTLLKTLGTITGCITVSYITLTGMMQDPDKPYRGHLNIMKYSTPSKNSYIRTETFEHTQNATLSPTKNQIE